MSDNTWYVAVGGQQQGPMTRSDIVAGIRGGRIGRDASYLQSGDGELGADPERSGIRRRLRGRSGVAPPPPPMGRGRAHEIDFELFGEDMQYVEVTLDPGEACVAEAGAFMYMDPGIQMETVFGDGSEAAGAAGGGFMGKLLSAGKRVVTGESLFMTVFGNSAGTRQKVAFAAPYPGKIIPIDLKQHGGRILCEKDAFLCAARGISVGIAFQRKLGAGFFGGEGFILQKLEGDGLAFLHSGARS